MYKKSLRKLGSFFLILVIGLTTNIALPLNILAQTGNERAVAAALDASTNPPTTLVDILSAQPIGSIASDLANLSGAARQLVSAPVSWSSPGPVRSSSASARPETTISRDTSGARSLD